MKVMKKMLVVGMAIAALNVTAAFAATNATQNNAGYQQQMGMSDQEAIQRLNQFAATHQTASNVQVLEDPRVTLQAIDQKLQKLIDIQTQMAQDQQIVGMVLLAQCTSMVDCRKHYIELMNDSKPKAAQVNQSSGNKATTLQAKTSALKQNAQSMAV